MKREMRVIGIDDGPFEKNSKKQEVLVVGTIFRGGDFLDGFLSCYVAKDGNDATGKIISMINKSKFKPQLQAIFTDGVAVAGFNIIDLKKLSKKTGLPVINVIRNYPDYEKFFLAMKKAKKESQRKLIESFMKPEKIGNVYVQYENISEEEVKEILRITSTHSHVPEPIRVAHIIASGVVDGESRGRA